jgi:regulator of replication initiation timing
MKASLLILFLLPVLVFNASSQDAKEAKGLAAKLDGTSQTPPAETPVAPVVKSTDPELQQRIEVLEQHVADLNADLKKSIEENKAMQVSTTKALSAFQQSAQFGGQVFANYSYTTNAGVDAKDYNRFDLERFYLTGKAQIFEQGKVLATTDVFRNSATGSYYPGLSIRLKFAYFDYAPVSDLSIKLGMIPTVGGYGDAYWKYRGISSSATDKYSFMATADLGASVAYTLPSKFGEVTGFILNGTGYASPEANRFKDVALKATVSPFPQDPTLKGLTVTGYVYKGANMSKASLALQRDRLGALVSYSYSVASIGVEYDTRKDAPSNPDTVLSGNALSFFGEIKSPVEDLKKFSFIWRWDVSEPNINKGNDALRFGVLGLVYKVHDKLTFAVDRQWTKAEGATITRTDGTKTSYDNRWFLHTIVNF